jgi:hypothetical protein
MFSDLSIRIAYLLNGLRYVCCVKVQYVSIYICAPGRTIKQYLCSREHNPAMFVLPGAQSRSICASGSTIQEYLCSREHKYCLIVLPGAQISRVSNLLGTYRRQYGEDLESFSTGKTKTNWLFINNETQRLRAAVRDQVMKLLAPAVLRHLHLPSNHPWTRQVFTL